ncbi:MAG: histidine kinase, partial [Gemmatimonadaceae bacterium]|nr:histidine kinase [Gemmatimonadaceae bacterium]
MTMHRDEATGRWRGVSRRPVVLWIAGVLLSVAALALFGAWRVAVARTSEEVPIRRGMQGTAMAIAGFIERWMAERHADAAFLGARDDAATLTAMVGTPPYEAGWILRPATRTVVESGTGAMPTDVEWAALVAIEEVNDPIGVSVFDPGGEVGRVLVIRKVRTPGDYLILRADMGPALRPYMESLKALTVTGRSFVASRSGDAVTVLEVDYSGDQLMHQVRLDESPPAVRAAVQNTDPPPVARDFRGVPAYVMTRYIPSLGWAVIRQVDEAEVLARVRRRALVELGLAAALLLGAGWIVLAHRRALRIRMLDADLARAQLGALRSQLQPHFLFNVLNNVGELMHTNVAGAEAMLHRLSHLLRFSLSTRNAATVPLWLDLDVLRAYVDIERVRCGDRVMFEYDVDGAPSEVMVPPLLLQPLVENALMHGLANASANGHILIGAAAVRGRLSLVVQDNGIGFAGADAGGRPGHGIGLGSTRQRLAHLYGRDHSLVVHSTPSAGTRITIDIPLTIGSETP